MANKARFIIAENNIKSFFKNNTQKVFSSQILAGIFDEKRILWNLPATMTTDGFIKQLLKREIIEVLEIGFEGYMGDKLRYTVPGFSVFQLATSLVHKSYLSHYSAVYLNGLTTQVPKSIYITFEQSRKQNVNRELKQKSIDGAFSKPQRKTGAKAIYKDYTFIIHNGMFTARQGVTHINNIPVTDIERTLIDIMVRPGYGGGVYAVLNAFREASDRVSLNKLIAILDNMSFIYPYYQSLGFYLEKAGYNSKRLEKLRNREKPFTFYLTYDMEKKDYSKEWNLYYPTGM